MGKWIKTNTPGVRYREHETRKNGVQRDRYFSIRYKVDGKDKEEALGWASQGWTVQKAVERLSEIKQNLRTGQGPQSLSEKRGLASAERRAKAEQEAANISFTTAADMFVEWGRANKKDWRHDEIRLTKHVLPVIGPVSLSEVVARHVEDVRKACQAKGLSLASVRHVLHLIRAVINHAGRMGLFSGQNPTKNIKLPKLDNKRVSFFDYAQAETLLEALGGLEPARPDRDSNLDLHDMALLSLFTGVRFGEAAALRWENVDLQNSLAHIMDAKSGESRTIYLPERVMDMMRRRQETAHHGLVFPSRKGTVMRDVPALFAKVVDRLGFNDGVTDRRQRISFHSCRHSFASWLAMQGEALITIQQLLGHKTIGMTMRYSHLMPDVKRNAVEKLGQRVGAKVLPFRRVAGSTEA